MRHDSSDNEVSIETGDGVTICASLDVPAKAEGIVLFAHGSGSSRFSRRNRFVAAELRRGHLATILIDLLTPREEGADATTGELRFNIPLLTERVLAATEWLSRHDATGSLRLGYFGASTGAAAALAAAATLGERISAVVSRGGRPDLVQDRLPLVKAATLLIVGGDDPVVQQMNEKALAKLGGCKELLTVPGASHLFEEPGKLETVSRLARKWFQRYISEAGAAALPSMARR